jgi:hypothetical protein
MQDYKTTLTPIKTAGLQWLQLPFAAWWPRRRRGNWGQPNVPVESILLEPAGLGERETFDAEGMGVPFCCSCSVFVFRLRRILQLRMFFVWGSLFNYCATRCSIAYQFVLSLLGSFWIPSYIIFRAKFATLGANWRKNRPLSIFFLRAHWRKNRLSETILWNDPDEFYCLEGGEDPEYLFQHHAEGGQGPNSPSFWDFVGYFIRHTFYCWFPFPKCIEKCSFQR